MIWQTDICTVEYWFSGFVCPWNHNIPLNQDILKQDLTEFDFYTFLKTEEFLKEKHFLGKNALLFGLEKLIFVETPESYFKLLQNSFNSYSPTGSPQQVVSKEKLNKKGN